MMKRSLIRSQRGFATLIALIMVIMLTLLGLAVVQQSSDEITITSNELQEMKAFYAAEAGMELASATLQSVYDSTITPPLSAIDDSLNINNCAVTYSAAIDGTPTYKSLSNGTVSGLQARVTAFSLSSTAVNPVENTKVVLTQTFEIALVPVYQWAIFYNNELEISADNLMSVLGRVHSNDNVYVQSNTALELASYVTSGANILHGVHPGSGMLVNGSDVFIKDAGGTFRNMKQANGSWLDASHADWYDLSVATWQGRTQDQTHGQGVLRIPMAGGTGTDLHKFIEPAAGGNVNSYEYRASLKFINGRAFQLIGGIWTDITANMIADSVISYVIGPNRFWDSREGTFVELMDLDIGLMYDSGYAPANQIIYFSVNSPTVNFPALRLKNGGELDTCLTIASQNPVYVWGDFNDSLKKPVAIMADAVTFLSNNWDDVNQLVPALNSATNTDVNMSFVTGNVPSGGSNYSGGFENLPRFLENWNNRDFVWSGSAINLWKSVQAVGPWSHGVYYVEPDRVWSYDTDLDDIANHPPEAPVVLIFQRTGWKQEFVGL
ncbi:MAG: hypothetical protein KOO62_03020 [candidate division Zixibacteria bacterium]|nr:hypothetical protein [candidate division Zixibacteria bacterium]